MAANHPGTVVYPGVRDGGKLILAVPATGEAVSLPPICVRCGAQAAGKPLQKTFYWHQPALYLLIILSPLIYAIVAMIVRKRIRVAIPFCLEHAKRRSIAVTVAWVLPLVGIADIFILPGVGVDAGITALITCLFLLAGIIIWAIVANPIKPRFIDTSRGIFTGCCEMFLLQLPDQRVLEASAASSARQTVVAGGLGFPPPPPPPIA